MKGADDIDAKLVKDYQAGNKKAMAELVRRWHLRFCQKAYWIVKDANLSKDVAQECWQIIMEKLNNLQDPNRFKSWAFRIVYTKSIDVLRQEQTKRSRAKELEKVEEYHVDNTDELTTLKSELLKGVKQLPEHQQVVLRLFYTEDYSIKEISSLLNISIGTTKSRLFQAREKLKNILKSKYKN